MGNALSSIGSALARLSVGAGVAFAGGGIAAAGGAVGWGLRPLGGGISDAGGSIGRGIDSVGKGFEGVGKAAGEAVELGKSRIGSGLQGAGIVFVGIGPVILIISLYGMSKYVQMCVVYIGISITIVATKDRTPSCTWLLELQIDAPLAYLVGEGLCILCYNAYSNGHTLLLEQRA